MTVCEAFSKCIYYSIKTTKNTFEIFNNRPEDLKINRAYVNKFQLLFFFITLPYVLILFAGLE
jgi:hypothetical protein